MKEEVVYWLGLQASDVIAISSACIAFMSGWITLWQGWLMRRHNILSVTPHIDMVTTLMTGHPINLIISNHGVGPAIVDEIRFLKSDKSKVELTSYECYELIFQHVGFELKTVPHITRAICCGTPIGAGKEIELFNIAHPDPITHLHLINIVEKMEFEVSYKCIYGKTYVAKSSLSEISP
ncbi:hypothetical protein ACET6F_06315 [Aeromonas veronii]